MKLWCGWNEHDIMWDCSDSKTDADADLNAQRMAFTLLLQSSLENYSKSNMWRQVDWDMKESVGVHGKLGFLTDAGPVVAIHSRQTAGPATLLKMWAGEQCESHTTPKIAERHFSGFQDCHAKRQQHIDEKLTWPHHFQRLHWSCPILWATLWVCKDICDAHKLDSQSQMTHIWLTFHSQTQRTAHKWSQSCSSPTSLGERGAAS